MSNSIVRSSVAQIAAGLYLDQQSGDAVFAVSGCEFTDNRASDAGSIFADTISLSIVKSRFTNNSADGLGGCGGAVRLGCDAQTRNCSYRLTENSFLLNSAREKGGVLCWDGAQPVLNSNVFSSNAAPYGANVSSTAVTFRTNIAELTSVASGQPFHEDLVVELLDHYAQVVSLDNSTAAELSVPEPLIIYGLTKVTAEGGRIVFRDFVIVAPPGSQTTLHIATPSLHSFVTLNVTLRNCTIGETTTSGRCLVCDPSTYSFDPSLPCQDCDPHAVCLGNFTVMPRPGYWRSSAVSTKIFRCPNQEACLGPPQLTGACAEGYEGNMCQTCAVNFQRASKMLCVRCPNSTSSLFRAVGFCLCVLLFCVILVRTTIKSSYKERAQYSISLKILMNYLQLVMLLGSLNLSWTKLTKQLLDIQDSAGGFTEQILSIGCLQDNYRESEKYYEKLVIMAFVPLVFLAISSVFWALWAVARRSYSVLQNELVSSAVVLFFLVHPSVVRVMFSATNCEEIEKGEYWVSSLELRCWQGEHWKYAFIVAVPSIILWGVGIPSLVLLVIVRDRMRLDRLAAKIRFGYLFNGYSRTKYYWEFVTINRKLLIIAIATFLSRVSQVLQALLVLSVLILSLVLHEVHKPYTRDSFNEMEFRGLLVSVVTLFAGLYYLFGGLSAAVEQALFAVIVAVNAYFLQYWGRKSFVVFLEAALKFMCLRKTYVAITQMLRIRRESVAVSEVTRTVTIMPLARSFYISKLTRQFEDIHEIQICS